MISLTSLIISAFIGIIVFFKLTKFKITNRLNSLFIASFCAISMYGLLCYLSPHPEVHPDQMHTLVVGTSADYPPFAFVQDDKVVGFDIDIIQEVAKRLHKKIDIQDMPFTTLIPLLQLGKIQVIASGMTETLERSARVLFTKPYLTGDQLIVITLAGNPVSSLSELKGKEVIVNDGYTADLYMSKIEGPELKRLKTPAEAFLALKAGRGFAYVTARNTVKPFFDQYGQQDFALFAIPDSRENVSLAVSKKYPELVPMLQNVLDTMQQDGTLTTLQEKWGLQQ